MRILEFNRLNRFTLALLGLAIVLITSQSVFAAGPSSAGWEFSAEFYVWTPSIKGETAQGGDIDISFSDIVDNLDFTLMGGLVARKDKFSLLVDVIYMDLEDDSNYTLKTGPPSLSITNLEMKSWVVTPAAAYTVVDSNRLHLDLLAGARYLYLESGLSLEERSPLATRQLSPSDSGHVWDAIVGLHGDIKVNKKWFLPFHFDVGTGDTDLTWQAFGGIGYKFNKVNLIAGYRHLEWDFDNSDTGGNIFNDLYISGPVVGFRYFF